MSIVHLECFDEYAVYNISPEKLATFDSNFDSYLDYCNELAEQGMPKELDNLYEVQFSTFAEAFTFVLWIIHYKEMIEWF